MTDGQEVAHIITILTEWQSGKTIECRGDQWSAWKPALAPFHWELSKFPQNYRVKPEPKLRPWTPEEVPVGAVLRSKSNPQWRLLIVAVQGNNVFLGPDSLALDIPNLLEKFVRDNTNEPCGVEDAS